MKGKGNFVLDLLIALVMVMALAAPAFATGDPPEKVFVCHAAGREGTTKYETIEVPANEGGYPQGHFTEEGTPLAGHEDDYLGQCNEPDPDPEPKALNLTFLQPCEPAEGTPEFAEWRIRNPNDFAVDVVVQKAGDGTVFEGSAPAGDSTFKTPWGAQTLILKWDGGQKVKAGGDSYNGQSCTCQSTIRRQTVEYGEWTVWEWNAELGFYIRARKVTTTTYIVDANDHRTQCADPIVKIEREIQRRAPDEVVVGVELSCGPEAVDGTVYQTYADITVAPDDGATLTFDGKEYSKSQTVYAGFGSYAWSAVAADGFKIVGDSSGSVKLNSSDCNGSSPPPIETFDAGGPADALPLAFGAVSLLSLFGAGLVASRRRRP